LGVKEWQCVCVCVCVYVRGRDDSFVHTREMTHAQEIRLCFVLFGNSTQFSHSLPVLWNVSWMRDMTHWHDSLTWLTDMTHWHDSLTWLTDMTRWHDSLTWLMNARHDSLMRDTTGAYGTWLFIFFIFFIFLELAHNSHEFASALWAKLRPLRAESRVLGRYCNTLQHTATHCSLQHAAAYCNTLPLQHTVNCDLCARNPEC